MRREQFKGGVVRDVQRLAGPLTASQLGAYLAAALGSSAEDCLVLPATVYKSGVASSCSPDSLLHEGRSVEDIVSGFEAIIGDGRA